MILLQNLLKRSNKTAGLLPAMMSDSSLLLKNIYEGLHSTRFAGKGENFWQFKEYTQGESISRIDWRKSASSKKILIKENEKELSKTIYLHFDKSLSMNYKSNYSKYTKLFTSALLTLTLCKLFSNGKEEVFIFNRENKPVNCSSNISNFNENFLLNKKEHFFPKLDFFKDKSLCIFFSDFLFDKVDLENLMLKFKNRSVKGYLIQILDPMEANFDFIGNTMLKDAETNQTLSFNVNDDFSKLYKNKLTELENNLQNICLQSGWRFFKFYTDQNISKFLINLSKTIILNK